MDLVIPADIWATIISVSPVPFSLPDLIHIRLVCKACEQGANNGARRIKVPGSIRSCHLVLSLFPHLTRLTLSSGVSGDISPYLPNLTTLSLHPITDNWSRRHDVLWLSKLTNLTALSIKRDNSRVENQHIIPLTKLRMLTLSYMVSIDVSTLATLNLERLSLLTYTTIDEKQFSRLTSLHTLKVIGCDVRWSGNRPITGKGVKTIPNLQRIITDRRDIMVAIGQGVFIINNYRYEGQWGVNGEEGYGKCCRWVDKTYVEYVGEWKGGKYHGKGRLSNKAGIHDGWWVNGIRQQ